MNCCNYDCRQGRDCPARRKMNLLKPAALILLLALVVIAVVLL